MTLSTPIRKVFQGVPDRRQMFRMFDRHAQRPFRWDGEPRPDHAAYLGSWLSVLSNDKRAIFAAAAHAQRAVAYLHGLQPQAETVKAA
jgi:antirestriction protein ArdC